MIPVALILGSFWAGTEGYSTVATLGLIAAILIITYDALFNEDPIR